MATETFIPRRETKAVRQQEDGWYRLCSKCAEWKPMTIEHWQAQAMTDGGRCRACRSDYDASYNVRSKRWGNRKPAASRGFEWVELYSANSQGMVIRCDGCGIERLESETEAWDGGKCEDCAYLREARAWQGYRESQRHGPRVFVTRRGY